MSQYQPAPAGEIEAEIVAASIGEVRWKTSDDNPRGECLRLRLSAGRAYSFVFADVPLDWRSMLQAVRRATGVSGEELRPEEYVGRRARVVLDHYRGKDGFLRATVTRWLQPQAGDEPRVVSDRRPTQSNSKPARQDDGKPSRNAVPQYGADDDIPF